MSLHPEIQAWLKSPERAGMPPLPTLSPHRAREVYDIDRRHMGNYPAHQYQTTTAGGVPVRVYRSPNTPEKASGALVYYHGGGFVMGNLNTHDEWCRYLANEASCVVVSVDYRLAPEHAYPAPVEDAWEALLWVAQQAEMLGIRRERVAVGGDSAGGNLAAVVAMMARESAPHIAPPICHQVLVYPVTDLTTLATASYEAYAEGYGLTRESMAWFIEHYLGGASAHDWRISPLRAPHHRSLAPAFIITAECDVLRDEGEAYARALMLGGNRVTLRRFEGLHHGFVTAHELECVHEARDYIAHELEIILQGKPRKAG